MATEILDQANKNTEVRKRKKNFQNNFLLSKPSGAAAGHKDMTTKAHISEILDSDNQSEKSEDNSAEPTFKEIW